jgi:hypothetical protein
MWNFWWTEWSWGRLFSTDNYFTSGLHSSVDVPEKYERPDHSTWYHNLSPYSGLHHDLGLDWTQSKEINLNSFMRDVIYNIHEHWHSNIFGGLNKAEEII